MIEFPFCLQRGFKQGPALGDKRPVAGSSLCSCLPPSPPQRIKKKRKKKRLCAPDLFGHLKQNKFHK